MSDQGTFFFLLIVVVAVGMIGLLALARKP